MRSASKLIWPLIVLLCTGCPLGGEQNRPTPDEDVGEVDDADTGTEEDADTDERRPASIEFPTERFVIEEGSPTAPEAEVLDQNGEVMVDEPINWSSVDPEIIEISAGGQAIGQQLGETELIAEAGEVTAQWPAEVVGEAVAEVTVIPEDTTIIVGQQIPYNVELRDDANGIIEDDRPVNWSSENPEVATVDAAGIVTGIAAGDTEIVAVVEGIEDRGQLAVEDAEIGSIEITPAAPGALIMGDTLQLQATVYDVDDNALEGVTAQWTSSDPEVAEVDGGVVEGLSVGETTITASFDEVEDSIAVEVVQASLGGLTSGDGFTCVNASQSPYCVGAENILGDGSGESSEVAVAVDFGGDVETVSIGDTHGCLVDVGGDAYCWGENTEGQLGTSSVDVALSPVLVDIDASFVDVSAGATHSCGVTDDDRIYCWGANDHSQLGDSDTGQTGPVEVTGGPGFVEVAAGAKHTCAIGTDDNGYCWGDNSRSQLGGDTDAATSASPETVIGGYEFGSMTAGGEFTCGTDPSGPPVCWGAGDRGQLGYGGTEDQDVPLTIALDAGESLVSIDAGAEHVCGIVSGGNVRCWGAFEDGRLGIDTDTDVTEPTAVDDGVQFDTVAAGTAHTCATNPEHELYCWGGAPGSGLSIEEIGFEW